MSDDLEFEIQIFIENHQKSNENKCGLNPITIVEEFSVDLKQVKIILNNLYKKKKIITREGLNSVLIFLPKTK